MNKATVRLLLIFLVVLMGSALLVYLVLDRMSSRRAVLERPAVSQTQPDAAVDTTPTPSREAEGNPFFLNYLVTILLKLQIPRPAVGAWSRPEYF